MTTYEDPNQPKKAQMPQGAAPTSPDPFAAMGGGVQVGEGWVPKNHPLAQQAAPAAPSAPAAAPGAPSPTGPAPITTAGQTTSTTTSQPGGPPQTIAQSFQQALISKLNPGPLDASNPAIAPAIQANQLAEQRGFERNRNLLAERAAKSGTDMSGGFDTDLLGLSQDRAMREGKFAGDAVQHLADRDNANLMAALGLSNTTLQQNANRDQQGSQFDQTLAEQKRRADQDAELRRLGITTQGDLGRGDLDLRRLLGEGNLNLGLMSLLTQRDYQNRALDQQGAQFGAGLDQSGLLGLLGLL